MLSRVRRTLLERGLVDVGQRVLLACSGGPDSVAMVDVMSRIAPKLRLTLIVASVDHGLRPEGGRDVAVAARHAERIGAEFRPLRVEIDPRKSLQDKARVARYAALLHQAHADRCDRIAVGHTLDDQAETVLSRVLRGAGLRGLRGIEPRRADGVIRPLIDVRRAAILAHVRKFALECVDDPSNRDPRHTRVRLRHSVLPLLAEEDPRVAVHLAQLADEARDVVDDIEIAGRAWQQAAGCDDTLDARLLRTAARTTSLEVLARWVRERTGAPAKRSQLHALERMLTRGGEVLLARGAVARIEGGFLVAVRSGTQIRED